MTYRIAFTGNILPDFDLIDVQTQTKVLLKLSTEEVPQFFSKTKIILKKNISLETAQRLQNQLQSIGLEICLESEINLVNKTTAPTIALQIDQEQTTQDQPEVKRQYKQYQEEGDEYDFHDVEYTSLKSKKFTLFLTGRLGRFAFINQIAWMFCSLILPIAITLAFQTFPIASIADLPSSLWYKNAIYLYCSMIMLYYARMVVLRLHDCHLPGYWGLVYLALAIPYIGKPTALLATLFLCIHPGEPDDNAYGKTPKYTNPITAISVALIFALMVIVLQFI